MAVAFFFSDRTIDAYFHERNGVSNQKKHFPNGRQIKEKEREREKERTHSNKNKGNLQHCGSYSNEKK